MSSTLPQASSGKKSKNGSSTTELSSKQSTSSNVSMMMFSSRRGVRRDCNIADAAAAPQLQQRRSPQHSTSVPALPPLAVHLHKQPEHFAAADAASPSSVPGSARSVASAADGGAEKSTAAHPATSGRGGGGGGGGGSVVDRWNEEKEIDRQYLPVPKLPVCPPLENGRRRRMSGHHVAATTQPKQSRVIISAFGVL